MKKKYIQKKWNSKKKNKINMAIMKEKLKGNQNAKHYGSNRGLTTYTKSRTLQNMKCSFMPLSVSKRMTSRYVSPKFTQRWKLKRATTEKIKMLLKIYASQNLGTKKFVPLNLFHPPKQIGQSYFYCSKNHSHIIQVLPE